MCQPDLGLACLQGVLDEWGEPLVLDPWLPIEPLQLGQPAPAGLGPCPGSTTAGSALASISSSSSMHVDAPSSSSGSSSESEGCHVPPGDPLLSLLRGGSSGVPCLLAIQPPAGPSMALHALPGQPPCSGFPPGLGLGLDWGQLSMGDVYQLGAAGSSPAFPRSGGSLCQLAQACFACVMGVFRSGYP
jgi:hypothetical protein